MRKSFHAHCRLGFPVPVQDLTDEQEKVRSYGAVRVNGEWCATVPCDFETADVALWDEHMAGAHGRKIGNHQKKRGGGTKADRLPPKMWNGPRLTEAGKPFEPNDLEPGATVTWRELVPVGEPYTQSTPEHGTRTVVDREWVERSGQVWSGAPYPRSLWVVPFEKRDGELAVLVRQEAHTGSLRHSQTWTVDGYRDVA